MTIDTEPVSVETTSKVVKAKAFTPDFVTALSNYLGSKPYTEVANFVEVLSKSPEIDVTITQNAPESN